MNFAFDVPYRVLLLDANKDDEFFKTNSWHFFVRGKVALSLSDYDIWIWYSNKKTFSLRLKENIIDKTEIGKFDIIRVN